MRYPRRTPTPKLTVVQRGHHREPTTQPVIERECKRCGYEGPAPTNVCPECSTRWCR